MKVVGMSPEDCMRRPHDVARLCNQQEKEIGELHASLTREQGLLASAMKDAMAYREQRDEARKALCQMSALIPVSSRLPLEHETARDVCLRLFPGEVDRLFPPGGTR